MLYSLLHCTHYRTVFTLSYCTHHRTVLTIVLYSPSYCTHHRTVLTIVLYSPSYCTQAKQLLNVCGRSVDRVLVMADILLRLADPVSANMLVHAIIDTPGNRARLRRVMGAAFAPVVLGNTTGLYDLDMSIKMERETMIKILEANARDGIVVKNSQRGDTSQNQDGHCIRNFFWHGLPPVGTTVSTNGRQRSVRAWLVRYKSMTTLYTHYTLYYTLVLYPVLYPVLHCTVLTLGAIQGRGIYCTHILYSLHCTHCTVLILGIRYQGRGIYCSHILYSLHCTHTRCDTRAWYILYLYTVLTALYSY
jgi:hypothetical protein